MSALWLTPEEETVQSVIPARSAWDGTPGSDVERELAILFRSHQEREDEGAGALLWALGALGVAVFLCSLLFQMVGGRG